MKATKKEVSTATKMKVDKVVTIESHPPYHKKRRGPGPRREDGESWRVGGGSLKQCRSVEAREEHEPLHENI